MITNNQHYIFREVTPIINYTDAERHDYRMIALDDLKRYKEAKRSAEHYRKLIQLQQDKITSLSAIRYDRDIVRVSRLSYDDAILRVVDMRDEYFQRVREAEDIAFDIERKISLFTYGVEQRILQSVYLYDYTLERCAVEEYYSYRQIKRYHNSALVRYGDMLSRVSPYVP